MSIEDDVRFLKHQITLLNAAVHVIARHLPQEQKALALPQFQALAQITQAHLEASSLSDCDLEFFLGIRQTLEAALGGSQDEA